MAGMGAEDTDIAGKSVSPPGGAHRPLFRKALWGAGILAALLLVLFVVSYFLDEPLRESMERRINAPLKGYSVRLPGLHLQLVGMSLTLKGMTVIQQANPDPPIARFPVLRFGIHWAEILRGKVVAEVDLVQPDIQIDLRQYRTEAASAVPIMERGWQRAVEAIYPFKINELEVEDGSITYIDQDPEKPLRLIRVNLLASNIRNVRLPDNVYPSSFRMETAIFGTGRGIVEGKANFLAEPHLGINARMKLENVPLEYFKPVVARTNLSIKSGTFSGAGRIEYAPNVKVAHLEDLSVQGMEIDYVHSARTAEAEKRRAEAVGKAVKEAPKAEILLRVDKVRLAKCSVGMRNENADPPYRVYLTDADLLLTNLSNKFSEGPADMELVGAEDPQRCGIRLYQAVLQGHEGVRQANRPGEDRLPPDVRDAGWRGRPAARKPPSARGGGPGRRLGDGSESPRQQLADRRQAHRKRVLQDDPPRIRKRGLPGKAEVRGGWVSKVTNCDLKLPRTVRSAFFPRRRLPLPLSLARRRLPRPGGQFLVVLDDLLRDLVIRLQHLVPARRKGAHPPVAVLLARRLVGLEVKATVIEYAEEVRAEVEPIAAEHRPAAYVLQGAKLVEHEVPVGVLFLHQPSQGVMSWK
jgi:hypothetical protein